MRRHYLTPTTAQRGLGLVCLGAGIQHGPLRPTHPRTLDCHALVLISRGAGRLRWGVDAVEHEISAPTVFFLLPGVRHSYVPSPEGWHERWVLFEGSATLAYRELGYLPSAEPVWGLDDVTAVRRAFDGLLARCRPENTNAEVETAALLHRLLVEVQRSREQDEHGRAEERLIGAFRAAACSPRSIPEHARQLGVSLDELRTIVRDGTGCTPKELLLRIRLNEAKALLAESRLPIAQVARRVGYDDPAYFSRLFTRRTGIAPRDFRHQQDRTAPPPR